MTTAGFIIHLARATARKPAVEAMRRDAPCPMEVFDAVDGSAMEPPALRARVRSTLALRPAYPFDLSVGEIACFLSHRAIWTRMVAEHIPAALVLEDDAVIDPAVLHPAFDLARAHLDSVGVIQFQTRAVPPKGRVVAQSGSHTLRLPVLPQLRTTGMLLSRAAAGKLLDASEVFDRPVDSFFQMVWHTGQEVGVVDPSGLTEMSDALGGTTIQRRKKTLLERLHREIRRPLYRRAVRRAALRHAARPE
jgi:glycosyl transferase family 25